LIVASIGLGGPWATERGLPCARIRSRNWSDKVFVFVLAAFGLALEAGADSPGKTP
jgi:hypothetical protein